MSSPPSDETGSYGTDPVRNSYGVAPGGPGAWPEEEVISLRDLLRILYRGRWIMVGVLALVLSATGGYTYLQEPVYESSLLLYLDREKGLATSLDLSSSFGRRDTQDRMAIEVEILRSRAVARRAAQRLIDERTVPGTGEMVSVLRRSGDSPQWPTRPMIVDRLLGRIRVQTEGEYYDRMIRLTATSPSPEEAALLANAYSEAYLAYNRDQARSELSASRKFLNGQKARYEKQLAQAERALRRYREEAGVVALDERSKRLVQQQADLESMRDQAQVELKMTQASLRTLEEKAAQIEPGLAQRVASGLDRELRLLQEEKARLETNRQIIYSKNPRLRDVDSIPAGSELARINDQLTELRDQIDRRARSYVEEVMETGGVDPDPRSANEVSDNLTYLSELRRRITQETIQKNGLEARLSIIDRRLEQYQTQFDSLPERMYRLAELQRAQKANEELYMYLVEKLQDTRLKEQAELGYAHRIDRAQPPGSPVSPNRRLNLLLGAVLGCFLGAGAVFLREGLDSRIYRPEELQQEGYPVSGVVLDFEEIDEDPDTHESDPPSVSREARLLQPTSVHGEAFRRIRLNLEYDRGEEPLETVLVTSPEPGDGKTVTAINLAASAARAGQRTALVDADLRHPGIHGAFGRECENGLSELLALHDGQMNGLRPRPTDLENLDVLCAGAETAQPGELLEGPAFAQLVDDLRARYDMVVFDSAPLLAVSDALPVARTCDASLMVVSSRKTHRDALEEASHLLEKAGRGETATVLNRFRPDAVFGYYYGYYKYYPEAHESIFKKKGGRSILLKLGGLAGLVSEGSEDERSWRNEPRIDEPGGPGGDSEDARSDEHSSDGYRITSLVGPSGPEDE